jgi:hypothetical protein
MTTLEDWGLVSGPACLWPAAEDVALVQRDAGRATG